MPNIVEITHVAGGAENTNPADDKAGAVAFVPEEFCNGVTNLALQKTTYGGGIPPDCPLVGNATWCRRFRIAVYNTGPGTFNGPIKVVDLLPPGGVTLSLDGVVGPWSCNNATKTCQTNGNVVLKPNDNNDIVFFNANVSGDDNVARTLNCKLNNWARIVGPVGAPQNIQAADDQDHAAYDLPARMCHRVEPASQVCPPGFRWTGDRCSRGPGLVTLPGCPDGQWLNKGHCCPVGEVWTGRRCAEPPRKECPEGTTGKWPNCREVKSLRSARKARPASGPTAERWRSPRSAPKARSASGPAAARWRSPSNAPTVRLASGPTAARSRSRRNAPKAPQASGRTASGRSHPSARRA